ncbi:MAG: hypothetical protein GY950_00830 [bacterium]|nr:hypothetical protein [bacterium]
MAINKPPIPTEENVFIAPTDKYVLVRIDEASQQIQVMQSAVVTPKESTLMLLRATIEVAATALATDEEKKLITPVSPIIKL